eukprot:Gb_05526 [translate_table: standard]
MLCGVLIHGGFRRSNAVLQLLKCTLQTNPSIQHKWLFRYIHSSIRNPVFLSTNYTLNALELRKGPAFGPLEFLQIAQLSGKATKVGMKIPIVISGNTALEAQRVLLDYLHYTRSLQYTDAEYISMNSPCFVKKLLSTVRADKSINKTVGKFLQYHPINEFEPFFESIGIQPSDIGALLPPDQIYLSENKVMLANVSTLWNYGIPRNKLGRIYKEESEIFNYPSGVLKGNLQAYEDLGFSKACLAKIFICCPYLLKGNFSKEFDTFINYLNNTGVEKDNIVSFFENNTNSCKGVFGKFRLLDGLGCPREEVNQFVGTHSQLFFECPEKDFHSKINFLLNVGLKKEDVGSIILQYPGILKWNLEESMEKNLELLGSIGLEQEELREIVRCYPYVLGTGSLKKLIAVMKEFGLDKKEIARLVREHPKITASWSQWSKSSPEQIQSLPLWGADRVSRMKSVVSRGRKQKDFLDKPERQSREQIRKRKLSFFFKLGIKENSSKMMEFTKKMHGRGDDLQERFNYLLSFGLSFDDLCEMTRSAPIILNQSKDMLEKKVDFLLNHLGCPLQVLMAFPSYLCYSLESRIKPRYKMYDWLKEQKLIDREHAVSSIVASSEEKFVKYFVNLHPEGPKVYQKLRILHREEQLNVAYHGIQSNLWSHNLSDAFASTRAGAVI